VLIIGRDKFTRADLAGAACFHFIAARHLSAALAALRVKDTRDVFEHLPPVALARPTIGVIAFAVLGAAFEVKHLGGDAPLENWVKTHAAKVVTVETFKQRARAADEAKRRLIRARA
jgi:hypothetical protein